MSGDDTVTARRRAYLEALIPILLPEADEYRSDPRLSIEDQHWLDWLDRTGELPPDFESLPAIADLPDPLVRIDDGEQTRVCTPEEWAIQREALGEQLQHWLYGELPPAPGNVRATELASQPAEAATVTDVRLEFGPSHAATLHLQLLVPDGDGPFPVFMTQWNHRKWAEFALQRGYVGVVYAAADARDDAANYREYFPEYDFQLLARRAWAAHRVVDYLYTLPFVDRDCIAITGASRNGKQSLIAAAFDERITAVAPSSSGSGGALPARFDRDDFYAGDVAVHARLRRSWFHPRWRFFVGRENQLPVDANSLVAMVAPRACMISTALNELTTNAWAKERVYQSVRPVYELLAAENRFALHFREGHHGRTTRDVEQIIDFFDAVFGRGEFADPTTLYHDFDFDEWARTEAGQVDVTAFPKRGLDDLLLSEGDGTAAAGGATDRPREPITTPEAWEAKNPAIRERIRWSFGKRPVRASQPSAASADAVRRRRSDYLNDVIGRPGSSPAVGKLELSPTETYGERIEADLYYPRESADEGPPEGLPTIIWLHPYAHNVGYGAAGRGQVPIEGATDRGFGLYAYDQLGFGTRIREGEGFYRRHPDWSKMGKLVEDALAAVENLSTLEFVDAERIYVLGYSLGATVGLYAAALDERIRGIAAVGGIPSFRLTTPEKERAHAVIGRYSHQHGLHPRLGHFRDEPERTPFDFHEVLALVAPRPLLAVAPELDWHHPQDDVVHCVEHARAVYEMYGAADRLDARTPYDVASFDYHEARLFGGTGDDVPNVPLERRDAVFDWFAEDL